MADLKEMVVNALRNVPLNEAIPFGAATTPEGSPTALSNMLGEIASIPKNLVDASKVSAMQKYGPPPATLTDSDVPANDPLIGASARAAMMLAGMGAPAAVRGAAGMFGGKLAKTADIEKLIYANKMREAGKHPVDIVKETGWFRTPTDNKWKFEIPDDKARMMGHGLDYTKDANFIRGPLEALLDHPELYKAYPQMKSIDTYNQVFKNPRNKVGEGSFNNGTWGDGVTTPTIEVAAPDLVRAKSVALHEGQHVIQDIENFARGGNPSQMAYIQEKMPRKMPLFEQKSNPYDIYKRLAGEVESRNVQERLGFNPELRAMAPPWRTQDTPFNRQLLYDPNTDMIKALKFLK